ncbi:hypothetical protein GHK92_06760 [Nocardioides sp. dk4132]|uniref:DUF2231 domain-containing protein n=1 Tax=unclassified Nocardioides TaxID=2615069 RepID=UPI00129592B1|nr:MULTISPECIES: DUF2231 domain-containing protein [unclassified Nocardioides]MQW75568.1 hypothetical protein [Nocardioides sp. dk4132]QGA08476.1 hypothetical protein GFH29_14505 [Nocardioides sp. dk884]
MEINGMPLHALVIHGAVVLGPLAALLALVYVVPRARQWARGPMVATAVVAAGFVVAAYLSGSDLLDANPALRQLPAVASHEDRAAYALTATLVLAVLAVAAGLLHRRPGAVGLVVRVLLALAAVATLVAVIATGDAGARAVWGGR